MKLSILLIFVAALAVPIFASDYPEEDNVLVLDSDNFDDAVKEFDPILVEFYAPWCGHCKRLAPEYAKAAGRLLEEDPPLRIAKVDATEERELAEKYGVQGFPTLKFFRNGNPSEYGGGRTEKEIVNWVLKKSGPAAKTVTTADAVDEAKEANEVMVLGVFDDAESAEANAFMAAASSIDDVAFYVTSEGAVADHVSAKSPAVVLFKNFDEGRADFDGEFSSEEITTFVSANSLPLVIKFTQEMAPKIFGGSIRTHMLMFVDEDADDFENLRSELKAVSQEFKGKALAIYVTLESNRVMEYFGFNEENIPGFVVVSLPENAPMKKYLYEGGLNSKEMSQFVQDYIDGKVKPFLKSDEPPQENDGPVKVLVGKTFEEIAFDEDKDVLVEFYAPWCGHCKALAPKYEELGERYADHSDKVVIAKMDATANEVDHPDVNIRGFPTIKFFPAGSDRKVIDYDGAREVDDFVNFIKKHAKNTGIDHDEL